MLGKQIDLVDIYLVFFIFFLPLVIGLSYLGLFFILFYLIQQYKLGKMDFFNSEVHCWPVLLYFFISCLSLLTMGRFYTQPDKMLICTLVVFAATVAYFSGWKLINSEKRLMIVVWTLIGLGFILAISGLYQYYTGEEIRVKSFTGHPNILASYLIIVVPLNIILLLERYSSLFKVFLITNLILMFVCMALTFSRSGWLGLFISLLVFLPLITRKRSFAFIIIGTFFLPLLYHPLWERAISIFSFQSNISRIYIWNSAINMLKSYWLTGIGIGMFRFLYPYYMQQHAIEPLVQHAHNTFLQRWVELGISGFLVFIWLVIYCFWQGWKSRWLNNYRIKTINLAFLASAIGLIMQGLFDDLLYDNGNFIIFWFILGLISANKRLQVS